MADILAKAAPKQDIHKQQWFVIPRFLNFFLFSNLRSSSSVVSLHNRDNIMLVDANISNQVEEIRVTNILDNPV